MRRVSAKFVPRVLTGLNKSNSVCQFHWSCAIVLLQIPAFYKISWEMKLGSVVMILRPGFRVLNGNHPVLVQKSVSIKIQHQGCDDCVF